jgi:hypothetical protein
MSSDGNSRPAIGDDPSGVFVARVNPFDSAKLVLFADGEHRCGRMQDADAMQPDGTAQLSVIAAPPSARAYRRDRVHSGGK